MRQLRLSLAPSGALALFIPAPASVAGGHTVEIPCSVEGLALLRDTLQRHTSGEDSIGSRGAPVQHDIQALLAAFRPEVKKTSAQAPLSSKLSGLQLDLSDLDL